MERTRTGGAVVRALAIATLGLVASGCGGLNLVDFEPPRQVEVRLGESAFQPVNATVAVGGTVTWRNTLAVSHTVTPDDPNRPGTWTAKNLDAPGATFAHTFSLAGEYFYHCLVHNDMAVVRVQ
jgi:plastocyanin